MVQDDRSQWPTHLACLMQMADPLQPSLKLPSSSRAKTAPIQRIHGGGFTRPMSNFISKGSWPIDQFGSGFTSAGSEVRIGVDDDDNT
ncbi:hypothetical protein E4U35_000143 [Claviceps purpurea]|nr:hypothetical protein E4U12_008158 [Claviceps purpurea]KAG6195190.1 hypothetical protein E4U35_000143 [Claviceps purpurea]KAG6266991.1 hypothetical protein E4U48_005211 [Claviceps purpurea]KAG6268454.1 hypothetical protein E4U49_007282 [Claviceps purpurea]